MIKLLALVPWKRVATIAMSAIGAYQMLPPEHQSNPRVVGALLISSIAGVAVNGEKLMSRRKPKMFDVDKARDQVNRL